MMQICNYKPIHKDYRLKYKFLSQCSLNNSLYFDNLDTTEARAKVAHFLDGPVRFSVFIYRFDRVKISVWNASNVIVTADPYCFPAPKKLTNEIYIPISRNQKILSGPIVASIQLGISVGLPVQTAYGHIMRDGIIPLQLIPKNVLNNSVFICDEIFNRYIKEIIPLYGCKEPTMICNIKGPECVYVKNLFCVTPMHYRMGISGISHIRKFVQIIRAAAGTTNTSATKYVLMNREPNRPRYIVCFDSLVQKIKQKYQQINWTIYRFEDYSIVKQCAFWSTVKFIFGPCGSNLFNIVFMKENGVVVYMRDPIYADAGNNGAAVVSNLWVLSVPYHGWENKHFEIDESKTPVDICLALEYIGHGLYVLDNQAWPKNFSIKRKKTPIGNQYGISKFKESEIPIYNQLYWPELNKSNCSYKCI